MIDRFPSLDLIFKRVDEVVFGERFIFGEVDLFDQIFLLDHFAGDDSVGFGIYGEVGLREATLPQLFILDGVPCIYYFKGMNFFDAFL